MIDMSHLHEQEVASSLGYQLYTGTIGGTERMDDLINIAAGNRAIEYATAQNYETERYVRLRDDRIQSIDNEYERGLNANGVFRSTLTINGTFSELLSGDGGQSASFANGTRPRWNHSSGFYPKSTNLINRIFR